MTVLHVFDMDGTLLCGTTASLAIARGLGCEHELIRLEQALAANALDTHGFAAAIAQLWHALTPAAVAEVFHGCRWMDGLAEVMADITNRGERSLVITMSPDFFANHLHGFGVEAVIASRFPPLPLRVAPDPAGILSPADKVTIVERTLARHGLDAHQCVAYGDSDSDVPLFERLPFTVAVNASKELRTLTANHYDGTDLRAAYRQARTLLTSASRSGDADPLGSRVPR